MGGLEGLGGEEEDDLGGLEGLGGGEEDELGGLGLESKNKNQKAITEKAICKALGLSEGQVPKDLAPLIRKLSSKADELNPSSRRMRRRLAEDGMPDFIKDKIEKKKGESSDSSDSDSDSGSSKCSECDCDPCTCDSSDSGKPWETTSESYDPYAFDEDVESISGLGANYGVPALGVEVEDVVQNMLSIAEERQMDSDTVQTQLSRLALSAMQRAGIKLPKNKINEAVKQASDAFIERVEQLDEDQYKFLDPQPGGKPKATRAKSRSSFEKKYGKGSSGGGEGGGASGEENLPPDSEPMENRQVQFKIVEEDRENLGVMFESEGVRFILDYADPPEVSSEDQQVKVPVPHTLHESARAAAGVVSGDQQPFLVWAYRGLEQLRPIDEDMDQELSEAVATVNTSPDGSISISIDSDDPNVNVQDINDVADIDGEEAMEPVMDVGDVDAGEVPDAMPDFEGGEEAIEVGPEMGAEPEVPEVEPEVEPEAEPEAGEIVDDEVEEEGTVVGEDKDITDPEKSDYNTADDELRDQSKQAGKAAPKGNGNKLDGWGDTKDAPEAKTGKKDTDLKKVKPGENRQ